MDVKNTFLNGDLQEEVHTHPFLYLSHIKEQVCHRAIHGLKQASRAWFNPTWLH